MRGIFIAICLISVPVLLWALPHGSYKPPAQAYDDCKLTETQIRQLWITVDFKTANKADVTAATANAVRVVEDLCRSAKQPATPLPTELQKLAR